MRYKIFIVMPFEPEFNDFYAHLKEIIDKDKFEVFRADDLLNQQNILKDIILSINNSDLIIGDLTGLNPNVFYEIGLAHALRKDVILLTQDIQELPFDLRSYRALEYSIHFRKIKDFENQLSRILNQIVSKNIVFGNPVTDWLPIDEQQEDVAISKDFYPDNSKEAPPGKEEYSERGFIDFLADMEESMGQMTSLVAAFTQKTEDMSSSINLKTDEIKKAWESQSSGTVSYVRKLIRKAALILNEYGVYVSKQNKEYEGLWAVFEDSISSLIESPIVCSSAENINGFCELLNTMENVRNSMIPAKESTDAMADSTSSLKGFESTITRAANLIEQEIKTFVGLLDKSISTLDRVINLGREKLSNCEKK